MHPFISTLSAKYSLFFFVSDRLLLVTYTLLLVTVTGYFWFLLVNFCYDPSQMKLTFHFFPKSVVLREISQTL